MSSLVAGRIGLPWPSSAAWARSSASNLGLLSGDERQHEPEQGQRLDEAEADEHGRADLCGGLGLAGDAFQRLADQEAEPDAGAERAQAVADHVEAARDAFLRLGEDGCE